MKECHRFSNYYQKKIQCRKHYNAVYIRKLIEQMIDVPSALIANCAQPFFPRQNSLSNLILRNFTPFMSDCVLQFFFFLIDYSSWASLSQKVYGERKTVFKEEKLKDTIRHKWSEISQDQVRKAILSWKKRLRAVCDQSGRHIDHLFN